MKTKQVIVMRKDLNMRKGKMCAQACHASIGFLTRKMSFQNDHYTEDNPLTWFITKGFEEEYAAEIINWLVNSFRKICVCVDSEQELMDIHNKALDSGLMSNLIVDNGVTEFNDVKTATCIAIGPHSDEKFVGITDHLPLL